MAYVKKEDLVIFNIEAGALQALVTDIQWRKFKRSYKDKKTQGISSSLCRTRFALFQTQASRDYQ